MRVSINIVCAPHASITVAVITALKHAIPAISPATVPFKSSNNR